MNQEELNNIFTYHAPKGNQTGRYEEIRYASRNLAKVINVNTPDSKEKSIAIRKLREASMWANAGIACNE